MCGQWFQKFEGLDDPVMQAGLGHGIFIAVVDAPCFQSLYHLTCGLCRMAPDIAKGRADIAGHCAIDPTASDGEIADDQRGDSINIIRVIQ
jgi:hypothetical protein